MLFSVVRMELLCHLDSSDLWLAWCPPLYCSVYGLETIFTCCSVLLPVPWSVVEMELLRQTVFG